MSADSYDQQTVDNPNWLKRLSHRARFAVALRLALPQAGQRFLDYGAGDGRLVTLLYAAQPNARYQAYEPTPVMAAQAQALLSARAPRAQLLRDPLALGGLQADRLACCEVLEHLDEKGLTRAFADFRALLAPGGALLVSVPIETGLTALAKNLMRALAGQSQHGATLRNIVLSLLGRTAQVPRAVSDGYIDSHVGFNYRALRTRLQREGFVIEQEVFSPLPWLGGLLNSQVFWLCRRR